MSDFDIIKESRVHLNDEIYGIINKDTITFVHEDTTTYPIPLTLKYEVLVPGKLYDYEITQEDLDWLNNLVKELDVNSILI